MKLFGRSAPVAKELRVSWFVFFPLRLQISRHQMMIRDEHTSRCWRQRRVHSETPLNLTRLEARQRFEGRLTGNSGSCEITPSFHPL